MSSYLIKKLHVHRNSQFHVSGRFNSSKKFQVMRGHYTPSNEVILEDISLPGLAELKGHWHGSLDASGGGNGDTMV
jgi:hypothetical protein